MTTTNVRETIDQVIKELEESRVVLHGQGYCFAMAEIVQTMLKSRNVASRLVECQLTIIQRSPPAVKLVGHGVKVFENSNEFDTHMVCVTETDEPYLIDLSLGAAIVVPATAGSNGLIANAEQNGGNLTVFYRQKENPSFPPVLNQNILERIKSDIKMRESIRWLKILVGTLLVISSINAVRGLYEAWEVWVTPDNNWGPAAIQQLDQKIDHINEQLEPQNLKKRLEKSGVKIQPK